jgi:excinuclease ABC subunit C
MMQEMLERRLKHLDWPKPSLIVVDGGKGQTSSVKEIIDSMGLSFPLVGLAKREETIITSELNEIKLPRDSHALQLIMQLRDEAHRFAITYHRKLRSKATFE